MEAFRITCKDETHTFTAVNVESDYKTVIAAVARLNKELPHLTFDYKNLQLLPCTPNIVNMFIDAYKE